MGHLLWGGLGLYVLARGEGTGPVAGHGRRRRRSRLRRTCWPRRSRDTIPTSGRRAGFPGPSGRLPSTARGSVRGLLALPPILAMAYLTGHPQEWFLLVIALSLWAAPMCSVWRQGQGTASGRGGGVAALGECPGTRLGPGGGRAGPGTRAASLGPEEPAAGSRFGSAPRITRSIPSMPSSSSRPEALGGPADYFGDDNYWESVLSFGLIPLVLIAVAAVASPDRSRVRGWLILVVLSLWFAAGRQLGLCNVLYWASRG